MIDTSLINTAGTGANTATGEKAVVNSAITGSGASELFTRLLVAQIQYQDPLEPTDSSQFVNQLTQLSQMESLQALAQQTSASTSMMESMQVISLGAQVGSQISASTSSVTLAGNPVRGSFNLAAPSELTTLVLTSANGTEHTVELGSRPAGEVAFTLDPAAHGLPAGTYTLGLRSSGNETTTFEVTGTLQSVRLSASGGVVLNVSGLGEVAPTAVTQFNGRT